MAHRRTFRRSFQKPKALSWTAINVKASTAASLVPILVFSITADAETVITRVRGMVSMVGDPGEQSAFGMCVVSTQAFAIGATAIPGPISNADSDLWFVHQYEAYQGTPNPAIPRTIDSKAKRIIHSDDQVVVGVFETTSATAKSINLGLRFLSYVRGTGS